MPTELAPVTSMESAPSHWRLDARLAISNGKDAGSGRLDWRQDGVYYTVNLRAPVSGQSWQLMGDDQLCQLQGVREQPILSSSPEALLRDELGWELPVHALRSWIFGLAGTGAMIERDVHGRVTVIHDRGWRIEYRNWQQQDGRWLPQRIVARNSPYQVRLAVQSWTLNDDTRP